MHSADELEKSVRVTPPSAWVALVAFTALLAGLLAWAIFGTIATRVPTKCAVIDGQAVCFLSEKDIVKMHVGDRADVVQAGGLDDEGGATLQVSGISTLPVSRTEAEKVAPGDYLVGALMPEDWAYQITFEGDTSRLPENVPLSAEITVERLAPIRLLLRS
ncbi:MAG: hypothetical protein IJ087_05760 [Eggerthellaceae bacterium]|nr:hypothetical protein [Eggerthellaceae bacterium]